MKCCDQDGWILTLKAVSELCSLAGLHRLRDRVCRAKMNAIVLRHPHLKTNPQGR
jgi:hypothetical protein